MSLKTNKYIIGNKIMIVREQKQKLIMQKNKISDIELLEIKLNLIQQKIDSIDKKIVSLSTLIKSLKSISGEK